MHVDNAQVKAIKARTKQARAAQGVGLQLPGACVGTSPLAAAAAGPGSASAAGLAGAAGEADAFSGFDTPKSVSASPAPKKLCMVCMDVERGEEGVLRGCQGRIRSTAMALMWQRARCRSAQCEAR